MHQTTYTVRSTQVDSFGHLNNAAYLELFEWARWEWAADAGMPLEQLMETERIGPAVLHVDLTFRREVRMHQEVTITTWVHEIKGNTRFLVRQQMHDPDGTLTTDLLLTFVFFHLDKRRAVPLPPVMRGAWETDASWREAHA